MPLRTVALVINRDKPLAIAAGREIIAWLEARSVRVLLEPASAEVAQRPDLALIEPHGWGEAEMVIVLGGDGTLIGAAKKVAPMQVPVLGINTGHLGFLTELEGAEIFDHLEPILAGTFVIEQRMILSARVVRGGQTLMDLAGLNDVVVSKGPRARVVHIALSIGKTPVVAYPADGVIVATPTGSTAYSLSAGGPIVSPTMDVLLVTPICPHAIYSRSMVVSASEPVTITVHETRGEVVLSADGCDPIPLRAGDMVEVCKGPYDARLVRRHSYRFYDVLREKLANPWS